MTLPITSTLPLSVEQFRETFGAAFSDRARYPDAAVSMYLQLAGNTLSSDTWGDWWAPGAAWFAAHFLTLDQQDEATAAKGQAPGMRPGMIASKSVGPASVSYDTSSGVEADAGHWNLTTYGRRFIRTARLVGMGGAQVGGCDPLPGNWWPGSIYWST